MNATLVTVEEFVRLEPAFKRQSVYSAMHEVPDFPVVHVGRRKFIDLQRWEEFKRSGGRSLPGGWRKKEIA